MYRHVTSRLIVGVPLTSLMDPSCRQVIVTAGGQRLSFGADEVRDAVISRDKHEGHVILVLPGRNRDAWPVEVTAVECE